MTYDPQGVPEDAEELLAEASAEELEALRRTARRRSQDFELPDDVREEWHTLAGQADEELERRLQGES